MISQSLTQNGNSTGARKSFEEKAAIVDDIESRRAKEKIEAMIAEHGISRRTYERYRDEVTAVRKEKGAPLD